jgi:hypothetical protein
MLARVGGVVSGARSRNADNGDTNALMGLLRLEIDGGVDGDAALSAVEEGPWSPKVENTIIMSL